MNKSVAKCGENLLRGFAFQAEVQRVGTKVDLARPLNRTVFRHLHAAKQSRIPPGRKHAVSDETGQIDRATVAVIKLKLQSVVRQRFGGNDFHATEANSLSDLRRALGFCDVSRANGPLAN